ncbi:hypothetical protein CARN8_3090004 [mine drainage metagenome]|uniref:Uncharacterized protein n=1 Tax=mine drainage metagenome TaxID=410659 RepID=A0A3P3ZNR5_9ZZZZ
MGTTNVTTMNFDWDITKSESNKAKHGVSMKSPSSKQQSCRWVFLGRRPERRDVATQAAYRDLTRRKFGVFRPYFQQILTAPGFGQVLRACGRSIVNQTVRLGPPLGVRLAWKSPKN